MFPKSCNPFHVLYQKDWLAEDLMSQFLQTERSLCACKADSLKLSRHCLGFCLDPVKATRHPQMTQTPKLLNFLHFIPNLSVLPQLLMLRYIPLPCSWDVILHMGLLQQFLPNSVLTIWSGNDMELIC